MDEGVLLSNLAPVLTIEFYLKISLRVLGLILTPVGFWFFIVGLISPTRRRDEHLLYSWLISLGRVFVGFCSWESRAWILSNSY